jgi:hypothetical protein
VLSQKLGDTFSADLRLGLPGGYVVVALGWAGLMAPMADRHRPRPSEVPGLPPNMRSSARAAPGRPLRAFFSRVRCAKFAFWLGDGVSGRSTLRRTTLYQCGNHHPSVHHQSYSTRCNNSLTSLAHDANEGDGLFRMTRFC